MCFEAFEAGKPSLSANSTMINPSPIATSRSNFHRIGDPKPDDSALNETVGNAASCASISLEVFIYGLETNRNLLESEFNFPEGDSNV